MSTTRSRGLFITFEGPDGSGKSTQARLLAERLRGEGRQVLESVEPGGSPIGQQIRRILLDPANQELAPVAELLLMLTGGGVALTGAEAPTLTYTTSLGHLASFGLL